MAGFATSAERAEQRKIGVVGTTGVGKSVLIYQMRDALSARGFAGVTLQARSKDGQLLGNEQIHEIETRMRAGFWPKASQLGQLEQLSIKFQNPETGGPVDIQFFDPAGELFEGIHTLGGTGDASMMAEDRRRILSHLAQSDGLMILVDVRSRPSTMKDQVKDILTLLKTFVQAQPEAYRRKVDGVEVGVVEGEQLTIPVAVVLTKADELKWQALYRQPRAERWMETNSDLLALRDEVSGVYIGKGRYRGGHCRSSRFYFSSSVGWQHGAPNCRTICIAPLINPSDTVIRLFKNQTNDLLPNPARSLFAKPRGVPFTAGLPQFKDPLRMTNEGTGEYLETQIVNDEESSFVYGVYEAPNRNANATSLAAAGSLAPWNIAEPLMYVAGLEC